MDERYKTVLKNIVDRQQKRRSSDKNRIAWLESIKTSHNSPIYVALTELINTIKQSPISSWTNEKKRTEIARVLAIPLTQANYLTHSNSMAEITSKKDVIEEIFGHQDLFEMQKTRKT